MDGLINCLSQPGQLNRDTKPSSIYQDLAKTNPTLTDGNLTTPRLNT
jgi:hypothetical protein